MKCDGNHGGPRCADPECWNDGYVSSLIDSTGCAFNATEPLPYTYPLFKHMSEEHGLTLIESELYEIMRICKEIEVTKWKPIDTAPKDGTHVLVSVENECTAVGFQSEDGIWESYPGLILINPTRWMHLPEPFRE